MRREGSKSEQPAVTTKVATAAPSSPLPSAEASNQRHEVLVAVL